MRKIKKIFLYSIGAVLSFGFSRINILAQEEAQIDYGIEFKREINPLYGVEVPVSPMQTFLDKALSIILSPIFIIFIVASALITGSYVLVKRKNNFKKSDIKEIKKNEEN